MVLESRPALPVRHANPHIPATLNSGSLPPVKYQILNCQGQDILVGRLKIETPTPTGHAFILRRYDTGAISLTTMFRAAFPNAPDHEEKSELQWVKESYDLSGNNGGPSTPHITRLAGTWVDPELARELGYNYALAQLIDAVIDAQPDPNANYRRSGKGPTKGAASNENIAPIAAQSPTKSLPTPSPNDAPGPAKRRKEASPAVPSPQASPARTAVRRSSRQRSPGPKSAAYQTITSVPKTPRSTVLQRVEEIEVAISAPSSDPTVVEEEHSIIETRVAGSDLHEEDVREQKALIERLKAEREEAEAAKRRAAEEAAEEDHDEAEYPEEPTAVKRAREEEEAPLQFNFKEPEQEERAIATNKRISGFQMQPQQKQLAWGAAAFALGMSAVAFLPNFL